MAECMCIDSRWWFGGSQCDLKGHSGRGRHGIYVHPHSQRPHILGVGGSLS